MWKMRRKDYESDVRNETREMASSRHRKRAVHMNSQKLWQHVQGLHRFKSDRFPGLGGRSGHGVPLLIQKLCYFIILLKNIFFPFVGVSFPSSIPNIHSLFIYPKFSGYRAWISLDLIYFGGELSTYSPLYSRSDILSFISCNLLVRHTSGPFVEFLGFLFQVLL